MAQLVDRSVRSAPIWRLLDTWWQEQPDFFWAPVGEQYNRLDMVSGAVATVTNETHLSYGGLLFPRRATIAADARMLKWSTHAGVGSSAEHLAIALVSGAAWSTYGPLWKIGNASNGYAVAHGGTDDAAAGTRILLLREALAWITGPTSAWIDGAQVLCGGKTTTAWFASNVTTAAEASTTSGINSPSSVLYINGRNDTASSEFTVHAFALFRRSLTNDESVALRARLAEPLSQLRGLSAETVTQLFRPRRIWVPVSSGAPSLPTLSALTTKPGTLTSTGFTTRVTAS